MIEVGDLVKSNNTGEIGLVAKLHPFYANYYNVLFPNGLYTTHANNLELLEKK
mgnify:CR=1 FL=1|tara:strand:- start:127 stop:285 length:159 start_codon:yes stop_codon:yes gene_type:complete